MVVSAPATAGSRSLPTLAKYDVIEEIGHGGMATVYRAKDRRLGREVAVKVIHPHLRESQEVAHRFVVEAQAVAKLRHPNIVEVFDVSAEDEAEKYLVVELLRGSTLRRLIKDHGPLPPEIAIAIAMDVLSGLEHAHQEGVVHRDVKPENVLIEARSSRKSDPEAEQPESSTVNALRVDTSPSTGDKRVLVKLTDFGIAKLLDAQGVTSTGQVLGSPAHMAPEQIEGGAVDARSDVFGVGVMLYESVVGHLPFEGQNPAQVLRRVLDGQYPPADLERPTVGKRLSTILDKALAHDAADRYESTAAMRDALVAELKRLGIRTPSLELESFFEDPDAYVVAHNKRIITRLCELAQTARKEGRSLDAANDYNRALAYAPEDPQLLRIVARMQRDEARARMLRRAGPLALATVVVGVAAFYLTQTLKHRSQPTGLETPSATVADSASVAASASVTASASGAASVTTPATISRTVPITPSVIVPVIATNNSGAITDRKVTLTLTPPAGVTVQIDGKEPQSVASGDALTLDSREHTLRFGCVKDACEPQSKPIAAGKGNEAVSVELRIKDATVVVEASDPNTTYGIEEYPTMLIKPGTPVRISVRGYSGNWITVLDRANPSRKQKVDLRPGQQTKLVF